MQKFKRVILTVLCICLLIAFSCFVIYRTKQHDQHKAQVFGHSFGISMNLYSDAYISYASWHPSYCVADDGILYVPDYSGQENTIRQIGTLIPFQLSPNNFDLCLEGARWCAYGVDAPTIRSHSASSWKCMTEDGVLYYLILQDNGDVFLALGVQEKTTHIYEVYCLNDIGSEEVFINAYSN